MRIMGLDFGSKTVGVAVCDPLGITAQTVQTITRASENKMRQTLARIEQLIGEYEIERIVLGYPKNMNNTVGERGEKTQEFKAALERRTGLEVILWDERLTTVAAERVLIESGVRRENRKKSVDQIAAAMILQGYLDSLKHSLYAIGTWTMRPVASGVTDRRQERRNGRKDERRYDYHGDGFRRIRGFLCVGRNKDKCKELSACDRRAGRRGRRVLYP